MSSRPRRSAKWLTMGSSPSVLERRLQDFLPGDLTGMMASSIYTASHGSTPSSAQPLDANPNRLRARTLRAAQAHHRRHRLDPTRQPGPSLHALRQARMPMPDRSAPASRAVLSMDAQGTRQDGHGAFE